MLGNLNHQLGISMGNFNGIVQVGQMAVLETNIQNGANDLNDFAHNLIRHCNTPFC